MNTMQILHSGVPDGVRQTLIFIGLWGLDLGGRVVRAWLGAEEGPDGGDWRDDQLVCSRLGIASQ